MEIWKELDNIKNALTLIKETQSAGTPDEGLASIKETLITGEKHGLLAHINLDILI